MKYIFDHYDVSSKLQYVESAKHSVTTNGTPRGTITGKLQVQLTLIHKVREIDKLKHETFFNANKDSIIDVEFGEVLYSLHFSVVPVYTPLGGEMWKITTKFIGLT